MDSMEKDIKAIEKKTNAISADVKCDSFF